MPLGVPEVLREGEDVTIVTYGAMLRIVMEAAELLAAGGDRGRGDRRPDPAAVRRARRDRRVAEEDQPRPLPRRGRPRRRHRLHDAAGAGAQGGYDWLDSEPRTLSAKEHRPAYGSDGDYWSKPNRETIFETVYELMHEADPKKFPIFFR